MNSSSLYHFPFLIVFVSILSFVPLYTAQIDFRYYSCNNNIGNYSQTDTFNSSLNTALSAVISTAGDQKLFNYTAGENSQVYAVAFCRGDVSSLSCQSCRANAAQKLRALCPTQKEAMGWYDECMVRYSNHSILGTSDTFPQHSISNPRNASDLVNFNHQLGNLLRGLQSSAAYGDSHRKFAIGGPVQATDFDILYALAECMPYMTGLDCFNCIQGMISFIPQCCGSKVGAFIVNPSCNIRYESYLFYNSSNVTASPPPPPPSNTTATATRGPGNGKSKGSKIAVVVTVPIVVCFVLVALIFTYCFFKRKRWDRVIYSSAASSSIHKNEDDITSIELLRVDFSTVVDATENFSEGNKLGRGGFGVVYKF